MKRRNFLSRAGVVSIFPLLPIHVNRKEIVIFKEDNYEYFIDSYYYDKVVVYFKIRKDGKEGYMLRSFEFRDGRNEYSISQISENRARWVRKYFTPLSKEEFEVTKLHFIEQFKFL